MDIIFDDITAQTLAELEKTQKEFWNIPRKTAVLINTFIKMMGVKNALEIGTSNGYSGLWLGTAFKENLGKMWTIEFWEKRQVIAREHFKNCGVSEVITPLIGPATDILADWTEPLDFVFIDANKGQYIEFFNLVDKHLSKGGIITADNITSHPEKVKPFVDAIMADNRYQVEILDLPAGLLLAYKIAD